MMQFVDGEVEVNLKYQSVAKLTAVIHEYKRLWTWLWAAWKNEIGCQVDQDLKICTEVCCCIPHSVSTWSAVQEGFDNWLFEH